jgi:hypothetical protein
MTQWKLEPFGIKLSPTPEAPTPEALTNIHIELRETLESTLSVYLGERDPSFEYILLASVSSSSWDGGSRRLQQASTTVLFSGGVVSFKTDPTDDIDEFVQEAIETELAKNLATLAQTSLASVTTVTYVSLSPTAAPVTTPEEVPGNIIGSTIGDYSTDPESNMLGKVLGSIFGAILVLTGAVMLLSKPLTTNASSNLAEYDEKPVDEAATVVDEDDAMTDNGDVSEMAQYAPGELLDSVSVGSEWTISTSDEFKVKSRKRHSSDAWVATETFERDRQITLQKDMLQSEWSNVAHSQMPPTQEWASGLGTAMSFEQAHGAQGEEIYLMPPSRERRSQEGPQEV